MTVGDLGTRLGKILKDAQTIYHQQQVYRLQCILRFCYLPIMLVFTVKMANFLMLTVSGEITVKCLEGHSLFAL